MYLLQGFVCTAVPLAFVSNSILPIVSNMKLSENAVRICIVCLNATANFHLFVTGQFLVSLFNLREHFQTCRVSVSHL